VSATKETEGALEFLEAAYAWHLPEDEWLGRLADAAARAWGRPRWACGFTYDGSDVYDFKVSRPVVRGGPASVERLVFEGMSRQSPQWLARNLRTVSMGFGRPLDAVSDESERGLARLETVEFFGLNGLDVSAKGCFIGLGTERASMTAEEILVFQRLAYHLSSAYRLRRRLREQNEEPLVHWEALLRPEGELLEARGEARLKDDRQALARATRNIDGVRRARDREPTPVWRPRVRSRWTLIEAVTRSGERYIVARENQAAAPGFGALTAREQQVIASAACGKSNKEIAYELGVSHATIRVLMARAYRRLGVRTRRQLFELPSIKALRGE
jgi:DNA-binding CsgD family transcriptional regulator